MVRVISTCPEIQEFLLYQCSRQELAAFCVDFFSFTGRTGRDVGRADSFRYRTSPKYVVDLFSLDPGAVVTRNYFAQFDAFEIQFVYNSDAVGVSAWGKNASGALVTKFRRVERP